MLALNVNTFFLALALVLIACLFPLYYRILATLRLAIVAPRARVISRAKGGTVEYNEVTLAGEDGTEIAQLPPGTPRDADALLQALEEGNVLLIVGSSGPRHIVFPVGTVVHSTKSAIDLLAPILIPDKDESSAT